MSNHEERLKGYEALTQQKKEVAEKGHYQQRANAYIKAHANDKDVEYRVVVEPWRETSGKVVGTRVVAWAIHGTGGIHLNFNFSIFRIKNKEFINIKWAKGEAIEHALEKLFATPIPIVCDHYSIAQAVEANLGVAVSSIPHNKLKTFTRVDKTDLHAALRDISYLGRKVLDEGIITLYAETSQEPIWNRAVSKEVKKLFHRHVVTRRSALALLAQNPTDRHVVHVAIEALKIGVPKFQQIGTGPLVKNFTFSAVSKK